MKYLKALFNHFRLDNIYKSPLSTIIGLLVLYATYELIKAKIAPFEVTVPVTIFVLGAFFHGRKKTPENPNNNTYNPFVIFLVMGMSMFSCKSFQKLPKTQIDTVKVYYEKVIPKDSVSIRFVSDTIHHTIIEKQGRATLIIEKQKEYIKASAICDTIRIRDTLKILTEKIVLQERQKKEGFFSNNWIWIYGALLLAIIAISIVLRNTQKT